MLRLDMNIVFTIINILILFLIVWKFLLKPVRKVIDARQTEIDKQYAKAREAQDEAEAMKKKYEETMAFLDEEKNKSISEAREKANEEYEKIIADARDQADKIKGDAKKAADIQREKYMQQAKEEIADLVVAATAKLIASRQSEDADRELYDQFIAKTGENID